MNISTPSWYQRWLRRFIEPSPAVEGFRNRATARTLAALVATLLLVYFIPEALRSIHDASRAVYFWPVTLILLMAYVLSRTSAYRWGTALVLGAFTLSPYFAILYKPLEGETQFLPTLAWVVSVVVVGSLLLSPRATLGLMLFNLGLIGSLPLLRTEISFSDIAYPLAFIGATSLLLLVGVLVRENAQKQLEARTEQLQHQETIFHTLTEATTSAIFVHRGGKFLYVNPATEHITGYSREELLSMNFWEIAPPDWQERVRKDGQYRLTMSLVKPTRYELPIQRKDGEIRQIHTTTGLVPWEGETAVIGTGYDLTKLRRAEEQVLILSRAIEQSASSVVITKPDGSIEYVNPAFTRVTGYTAEEALGQNPRILKSGQHPPEFYKEMWDALSQGETWQGELVNKKKNGELYWEEAVISPVLDREGGIRHYVAVKTDITQRKAAEAQIRQQQAFLQTVIDSIDAPFYVIDVKDYRILLANKAARAMGIMQETTCYALTHQRATPCDGLEHPCPLQHVVAQHEPYTVEHIHYRPDGSPYYAEVHGYPLYDERGKVIQMVEYSLDITQRKEQEIELRKMYRATEQSASGIVITNAQGIIEYVNPAFTQMTGYRPEEAIGHSSNLLKSGKHDEAFYEEMWRTIEEKGEVWRGEIVNRRKDGSLYWEYQTISPIKDEQGRVTHYVAIKNDMTRRKELEEALQRSRDEALEASRLKTQLLGNVSHDMRTPLGAIVGYTEMLQTGFYGSLSEEQDKAIQAVGKSSRQLLDFVNDLLNQAQIESGKIVFRPRAFAPAHLLELIGADIALAQGQGLEIITEIDPSLPEKVIGDRYWVGQILRNLLSNAIKFTDEGHIRIALQRHGEKHWAIQVSDTGRGIPPEAQAYIFAAFRQVDGSPSRREHTGSGLGLSIVKHLAELMQGEVQLHSEIGKGTTFTIVLPLVLEVEEQTA